MHASTKPKFVAIGLDFFAFNASEEPFRTSNFNFGASNMSQSVYLFSAKTFQRSIASVFKYITNTPLNFPPMAKKSAKELKLTLNSRWQSMTKL